jgi:hypothetical protein
MGCEHGHIRFEGGGFAASLRQQGTRALCADCGADVTARERRADYWRGIFERAHSYEVVGPDGPVARFTPEEWYGGHVCYCSDHVAACATCQADELAGHSTAPLIAWHQAGHPAGLPPPPREA